MFACRRCRAVVNHGVPTSLGAPMNLKKETFRPRQVAEITGWTIQQQADLRRYSYLETADGWLKADAVLLARLLLMRALRALKFELKAAAEIASAEVVNRIAARAALQPGAIKGVHDRNELIEAATLLTGSEHWSGDRFLMFDGEMKEARGATLDDAWKAFQKQGPSAAVGVVDLDMIAAQLADRAGVLARVLD